MMLGAISFGDVLDLVEELGRQTRTKVEMETKEQRFQKFAMRMAETIQEMLNEEDNEWEHMSKGAGKSGGKCGGKCGKHHKNFQNKESQITDDMLDEMAENLVSNMSVSEMISMIKLVKEQGLELDPNIEKKVNFILTLIDSGIIDVNDLEEFNKTQKEEVSKTFNEVKGRVKEEVEKNELSNAEIIGKIIKERLGGLEVEKVDIVKMAKDLKSNEPVSDDEINIKVKTEGHPPIIKITQNVFVRNVEVGNEEIINFVAEIEIKNTEKLTNFAVKDFKENIKFIIKSERVNDPDEITKITVEGILSEAEKNGIEVASITISKDMGDDMLAPVMKYVNGNELQKQSK